ncbi:alpha/beta hydrolase [Paenibacillus sp. GCM10012307]|uniref:Lysophospholipase n=1 Tax=Paenibacillus roseus TaxID=2798579 RepID=A0A934J9M4_9BACL|nr:alpha/beta hydrolase [Paenibacillus roseus]MBJ6362818.1 lysophospholipase [Paenibacillus roseus]
MEVDWALIYNELELLAGDGQRLPVRQWQPEFEPFKGVICLIHGMGEHSGRYYGVAEAMTAAGYVVLAHDQRGHGRSEGKRGHADVKHLADDAALLVALAERLEPQLPRFLYGHSMGGNVALSCVLRYKPDIQGLILTSPWLRLAFVPPAPKVWAGGVLARLWPSFSMSTGLRNVAAASGAEEKLVDITDTLSHDRISARMYFSLHEEGEWALAHSDRLDVPLFLAHGDGDYITSFHASRSLSEVLGERCCFVPVNCVHHELHQTEQKEELFSRIRDWLDKIR